MVHTFIVSYKLNSGINKDDFINSVGKIKDSFYKNQEGFISLDLGFDEKENRIFEVHSWEAKSFTEIAHPKFMENKECLAVFSMADMSTMNLVDLNLIK